MIHTHSVLNKKGPLARIWLAAHWDKKLTKAQVFETDIVSSVAAILELKLNMALRTTSHLLLGVVRIYSRKTKYLLAECNEAYLKIRTALRASLVDLPEGNREAALASITLPDTLYVNFDFHLVDFDFDMAHAAPGIVGFELSVPTHPSQANLNDITIRESIVSLVKTNRYVPEDDFGDASYFAKDVSRTDVEIARAEDQRETHSSGDALPFARESTSIALDDRSMEAILKENDKSDAHLLLDTQSAHFGNPALVGSSALSAPTASQQSRMQVDEFGDEQLGGFIAGFDESSAADVLFGDSRAPGNDSLAALVEPRIGTAAPDAPFPAPNATLLEREETTLLLDGDGFALEPQTAERTTNTGMQRASRRKTHSVVADGTRKIATASRRKRRLMDDRKAISRDMMKARMQSTSDTLTVLDFAPPTKRLLFWRKFGTVDYLMSQPAAPSRMVVHARRLELAFSRRLKVCVVDWQQPTDHVNARLGQTPAEFESIEFANANEVQIENLQQDAAVSGANLDENGENDAFDMIMDVLEATEAQFQPQDLSKSLLSPIRMPVDNSMHDDTEMADAYVGPYGYSEQTMQQMTMNTIAAERREPLEQTLLSKELLALYSELQRLSTVPTSTPRGQHCDYGALSTSVGSPVTFASAVRHATRKQAAHKFLALLLLLKQGCVTAEQKMAYGDIVLQLVPGDAELGLTVSMRPGTASVNNF